MSNACQLCATNFNISNEIAKVFLDVCNINLDIIAGGKTLLASGLKALQSSTKSTI